VLILRQKIIFFSNFRGSARRVLPPGSAPAVYDNKLRNTSCSKIMSEHAHDPQQFSRLPPLGAIFLSVPPPSHNLKSWIHPYTAYANERFINRTRAGCSPLDPPLQYMTTNYEIQVVQRLCQSMRMTTEKNVLKAIYWFHILCFNRTTHNYWLWNPVLIRYRMRNKDILQGRIQAIP
jgi:hypothetical protein